MPEVQSTTVVLQSLLDRFAAGDTAARNELVNLAADRLMVIARKLLRSFGGEARVGMWTGDVLGDACPRILRALDDVKPTSPSAFFGLAWLQMQRALLDHVRGIRVEQGSAESEGAAPDSERQRILVIDLMEAISGLPDKQRETVWLKLAGYTHREIADILGVHHDTVDDYWSKACVRLSRLLAPFMETR